MEQEGPVPAYADQQYAQPQYAQPQYAAPPQYTCNRSTRRRRRGSAQPQYAQPQYVQPPRTCLPAGPAPQPAAPAAAGPDKYEQLRKLGEFHDQGILTDQEFAEQKARIPRPEPHRDGGEQGRPTQPLHGARHHDMTSTDEHSDVTESPFEHASRLAEPSAPASYGTVLVIAAVGVTSVAADVGLGYSAELVLGVGAATWVAHLYAELLGRHVVEREPLRRAEVYEAMVDGSPILLATVLPGAVLLMGRGGLAAADTALSIAMLVAFGQLVGIGVLECDSHRAEVTPTWIFAGITAAVGIIVGSVTLILGH